MGLQMAVGISMPLKNDFDQIEQLIRQLLYLEEDNVIVRIVYASYLANLVKGPPVWLMVLGPPSCGKTELIMTLCKAQRSMVYSTISAAALLSGYDSDVSILNPKANGKVLIVGDMSTMITGNKERLGEALGMLRHLYDGRVIRPTGKELLEFEGKVGFMAACTPDIDEYREFMASLGERYLYVKMRHQPEDKVFERVLQNTSVFVQLQETIRIAASMLVKKFQPAKSVQLLSSTESLIKDTSSIMARIRTRVERDRYTKEIVNVPQFSEGPIRIYKQLLRIVMAAQMLGANDAELDAILLRFAWDSIPEARARVLSALVKHSAINTKQIQLILKVSYNRTRQIVEDLVQLGMLEKRGTTFGIPNQTLVRATAKWAQ